MTKVAGSAKHPPQQQRIMNFCNKSRIGVPPQLSMVFLDIQEGKKLQLFHDNVKAFANYAGPFIDKGDDIADFIKEMKEVPLIMLVDPGGNASRTKLKIWEAECSNFVKSKYNQKNNMQKIYNIIWGCCTEQMRNKMMKTKG